LIKLLSAGWLAPSVSSSRGFPRSRDGRRARALDHTTSDGSSPPAYSARGSGQRQEETALHYTGATSRPDGPQERGHLAGLALSCRLRTCGRAAGLIPQAIQEISYARLPAEGLLEKIRIAS
jgi:hypothetical protein